jgi:hypothetical protein
MTHDRVDIASWYARAAERYPFEAVTSPPVNPADVWPLSYGHHASVVFERGKRVFMFANADARNRFCREYGAKAVQ